MSERAVFYQLTHKIVNDQEKIPETAQQVMYYSLAIGHHVGVMDCFQSLMEVPLEDYRAWIERLPEGSGRRKLDGVLKWGEIEINAGHADELLPVLGAGLPGMSAEEAHWTHILMHCLRSMQVEPALYLMVKKQA